MPSTRPSGAHRVASRTSSHSERHVAAKTPRATAGGPRPPRRSERLPIDAAITMARWGFGKLRATVADYPEEADAIDRVAAAVEAAIRGTNPKALDELDEADVLTTASILITAVDPDPDFVDAIAFALDALLSGGQLETARSAHGVTCRGGASRAPRTVRHLFLIP